MALLLSSITVTVSIIIFIDFLTGGRIKDWLKQHPWFPRLIGLLGVRRREILRTKNKLQEKLHASGYQHISLRQHSDILELAESFSISSSSLHQISLPELLPALATQIDEGQRLFSITSETGSGKTVFGMLLPILCHQAPLLQCSALYVNPSDWIQGTLGPNKVLDWIASWPTARRKLIIFDSFSQLLTNTSPLEELLTKLKETSNSGYGFLVLYRPISTEQAGYISSKLDLIFGQRTLNVHLHFDPSIPSQCAAYRHIFHDAQLSPAQLSYLLSMYADFFPGYSPTRFSAVFVLRHLYDRFRNAQNLSRLAPRINPPGDILFDAILFPSTHLDHPGLSLLSQIAFDLVKEGRHTEAEDIDKIQARIGKPDQQRLNSALQSAKELLKEGSLIAVQIDGKTLRIPNEIHVLTLASLHIARLIAESTSDHLPPSLDQFRGRSKYDECAPFILPAYRRIQGRSNSNALYEVMAGFLANQDAPFSFCARLIHSNYDFSLLNREKSEYLSSQLFRTLIKSIDEDRRKSCEESIRHTPAGNPILDQLFEVVSAYGDSIVRLLVDNILLTSQTDLEKSQGAYLILHWLNMLFASPEEEIRARRHHIYTILNGLEVLSTSNLHIRFHVVEVLDFLSSHNDSHLSTMPGFNEGLNRLLERYSQTLDQSASASNPKIMMAYDECNRLVSSWAKGILERSTPLASIPEIADKPIQSLLSSFKEILVNFELDKATGNVTVPARELELVLECYEVILGLTRRTCLRYAKTSLLQFIEHAADCPLWIVRWWAFYNLSNLVISLPAATEYNTTVSSCLKWMIDQLYRSLEPVGLKYRQYALLKAVERRPGARDIIRGYIKSHLPVDEEKMIHEYAQILEATNVAALSLEEYFGKLRRLHESYL